MPPSTVQELAVTTALGADFSQFPSPSIRSNRPGIGNANVVGAVTSGVAALSAKEYGTGVVRQTVIAISGLSVAMTDADTAGCHGSQKLYDFPAGSILVLGALTNLMITAGAGGIADGAAVVGAIGSTATATDNATLSTTEANMCPSTAATLTAGEGTMKGEPTAVAFLDGTGTPVDAYLNFAVPAADATATADTLTVTGFVIITWIALGDN